MEDFDIFTNKIAFTETVLKNTLNKLIYEHRSTPNGPNYESGHKLVGEACLEAGEEARAAFHLSEAVAATARTLALYRDEQLHAARGDNVHKVAGYLKPISELVSRQGATVCAAEEARAVAALLGDACDAAARLAGPQQEEAPFHKRYLRFSPLNNVDNFHNILKELPEEWTIVQLSAPYNGAENVSPRAEYRADVGGLLVTVLAGAHLAAPLTVHLPANRTREGEQPLFKELYAILDENYRTIDTAHALNNKRLVQNYWARRDDIDLRMKSVINVMEHGWLGGWGCLLAGRLEQRALEDRLRAALDAAIADWGLIRLTEKQRVLLCKVLEAASVLTPQQAGACVRRILTEHGDREALRRHLPPCDTCSTTFRSISEVCWKCLSGSFERLHRFSVADGVRALGALAAQLREDERWAALRRARRHPVILIVDEILDSFPWESVSVLKSQPVSRVDSLHTLYHLYKTHELRVVRGHYLTTARRGRYVINPEKNLDRMEKRMCAFVQYWCGEWEGHAGAPPPPDDFLAYLRTADIFLYCGHGDGCQFGAGGRCGAGVEGAGGARAVCLLSGCGSVRLHTAPGRQPPTAAHRRLHVAGCPTVVGMLWEVTDLEVDKVVTTLVALCVPPPAPPRAPPLPWHAVGKADWSRGRLETSVPEGGGVPTQGAEVMQGERSLLRAVSRARAATAYLMIASSVVVRGLPVAVLPDVPR